MDDPSKPNVVAIVGGYHDPSTKAGSFAVLFAIAADIFIVVIYLFSPLLTIHEVNF